MSDSSFKTRLSVVVIVRSDEQGLAQTLASVKPIADEIIVVDTGSTDGTREVAIRGGAKLVEETWRENFADVRNKAMSHVLGDWILWIDSGETLIPEDASQLRDFVEHKAEPTCAYAMLVEIPDLGSTVAKESVARVRLVPDVSGLEFTGRVRESLAPALAAAGLRTEGLPYRILRGAREHDPLVKTRRARRNIQLADLEIVQNGPSAAMLNCLGESFQTLNEHVRAAQQFRTALECSAKRSADMLEAYYGLLTALDGDVNNRETQLKTCLEALDIFPLDAQLLCAMGNYLTATNRIELAARAFEAAFRYGQTHPEVWHLVEIREIAACCWSLALEMQNQTDLAQQALVQALVEFPNSIRIRRQLVEFHIKHGQRPQALEEFEKLPRNLPQRDLLKTAVRGAAFAGTGNWISARAYLKTSYERGCRDPLCLRWLTATHANMGETDLAKDVAREWKLADPRNVEVDEILAQFEPETKPVERESQPSRNVRIDAANSSVVPTNPESVTTPHLNPASQRQEQRASNIRRIDR